MNRRGSVVAIWLSMFCMNAIAADADVLPIRASDADAAWCAERLAIPSLPTTAAFIDFPTLDGTTTSTAKPPVKRELVMSLALSGGGFRAMLFHVGTLRRLNDAGMLPRIAVISSVSGGGVVSAYLAYRWKDLIFDSTDRAGNFSDVIEKPLRELAQTTLDIPSVLTGLLPFTSAADRQDATFDNRLFHGALLSDVSQGGTASSGGARLRPLFIFNATSLQTGELWQFRATAMGGPIIGWTDPVRTRLSQAVAASSGFPPMLSPLVLQPAGADDPKNWHDCVDYRDNPYGVAYANEPGRILPKKDQDAYRKSVNLIDGGVRDNLGLASIEEMNRLRRLQRPTGHTVALISDGGASTQLDLDPSTNWAGQARRVLNLLSDQPDEVRVGNVIRRGSERLREFKWEGRPTKPGCAVEQPPAALEQARRRSALAEYDAYAYWSIRRMPKLHGGFDCPAPKLDWMAEEVRYLSLIPTAFRALPHTDQARLINWGYLAAHHGIPYVDFAWPDADLRRKWMNSCSLPYGPDVSDPKGAAPSVSHAMCVALAAP